MKRLALCIGLAALISLNGITAAQANGFGARINGFTGNAGGRTNNSAASKCANIAPSLGLLIDRYNPAKIGEGEPAAALQAGCGCILALVPITHLFVPAGYHMALVFERAACVFQLKKNQEMLPLF